MDNTNTKQKDDTTCKKTYFAIINELIPEAHTRRARENSKIVSRQYNVLKYIETSDTILSQQAQTNDASKNSQKRPFSGSLNKSWNLGVLHKYDLKVTIKH